MGYFSSVAITALDRRDLLPVDPPRGHFDDPTENDVFDPRTGPDRELTDEQIDALPVPARRFDPNEESLPF